MSTEGLRQFGKRLGGLLKHSSPTILTGLGVAGFLTTTIFAVTATPKALLILEEEQYKRESENPDGDEEWKTNPFTVLETIKLTWKCYLPAVIMGTFTIGCMISANSINLRRNAALATVYSISEKALKEYQSKVVETIGKNKEQKVRDEIAKDRIDKNPPGENNVIITGKGETLCYDAYSGRYFTGDMEKIRKVVNDLNQDLLKDDFVTLNEFYEEVGLENSRLGEIMGWSSKNGLIEFIYSAHLTPDGRPCIHIDYSMNPIRWEDR